MQSQIKIPSLLNNLLKVHLHLATNVSAASVSVIIQQSSSDLKKTKVKTFNGLILFDKILSHLNQTWLVYDETEAQHNYSNNILQL